jgi:hypothetical protein
MDKSEIVIIKKFSSIGEAEVYKALLESAGINAELNHDVMASVMPAFGGLLDVELVVAAADEKRAKEVLHAKFDKEEFAEESVSAKRKK